MGLRVTLTEHVRNNEESVLCWFITTGSIICTRASTVVHDQLTIVGKETKGCAKFKYMYRLSRAVRSMHGVKTTIVLSSYQEDYICMFNCKTILYQNCARWEACQARKKSQPPLSWKSDGFLAKGDNRYSWEGIVAACLKLLAQQLSTTKSAVLNYVMIADR